MVLTPHAIVGNLLAALEGTPGNKATMRAASPGLLSGMVPALQIVAKHFQRRRAATGCPAARSIAKRAGTIGRSVSATGQLTLSIGRSSHLPSPPAARH